MNLTPEEIKLIRPEIVSAHRRAKQRAVDARKAMVARGTVGVKAVTYYENKANLLARILDKI